MTVRVLSLALAASVALLVRAELAGASTQVYLFKPLSTLLVLALALVDTRRRIDPYRALVAVGVLWSLAGDVFLMLPSDQFVAGLASFLVAHLCYIGAFTRDHRFSMVLATGVPLLALGGGVLALFWPGLGALKVPVVAYVAVILAMAWQALERWRMRSHAGAGLAALGALLFVASDASLGFARFRDPFPGSRAIVLLTYYAAQWLIALSVVRRARALS